MRLTKQEKFGFYIKGTQTQTEMNNCQFEGSQSVGAILSSNTLEQ